MAVYRYVRFSTDKQDEQSQCDIIARYCEARGIVVDATIRDEGISGKEGSLSRRDLLKLLMSLREGDTLVVSELSRLTRGGSIELNRIIGDYFRPAKIRLILCNYAMEFDCANLTPMNELILNCFAVFAKMERDSIIERTNAGLNQRKEEIRKRGGFLSKSGNWCTHLGNAKGADMSMANAASCKVKTDAALAWCESSPAYKLAQKRNAQGVPRVRILEELGELWEIDPKAWGTRKGCRVSKGVLSKWLAGEATYVEDMTQSERRSAGLTFNEE